MGNFVLGLLVGLFIGAPIGLVVMALCVIAKRSDEQEANIH